VSENAASPSCPVCGGRARWVDDAWVCTRRSCGAEWYPESEPEPENPNISRIGRLFALALDKREGRATQDQFDAAANEWLDTLTSENPPSPSSGVTP
jgi:hypothetical protein